MSIERTTVHVVKCDGCGEEHPMTGRWDVQWYRAAISGKPGWPDYCLSCVIEAGQQKLLEMFERDEKFCRHAGVAPMPE